MLLIEALNLATQSDTREERRRGTDALLAMCDDERQKPRRWCAAQVLLKAVMKLTLPPEVERTINDMMAAATKDGADFTFLESPRSSREWMEGAMRLAAWGDGVALVEVIGTKGSGTRLVKVTGPKSVVEDTLRCMGIGQLAALVTEDEA